MTPPKIFITSTDPVMAEFLPPHIIEMLNKSQISQEDSDDSCILQTEKINFDYKMVNCNQDLKELVKKLKKAKTKQWSMLLYGEAGCGKSEFAKYLAQELHMPIIKKEGSSILSKWVGDSEQNVKRAFDEAKEKKAILLIDEADSMLTKRTEESRDYQVQLVNEMLCQMEAHDYPFIMTTNLKSKIDKASLRRFIFKIKYDYMTPENIKAGIKTYFGKGFKFTPEQYNMLPYITAGDFKVAKRKIDILEDGKYTNDIIFNYLKKEQDEKEIKTGSSNIKF